VGRRSSKEETGRATQIRIAPNIVGQYRGQYRIGNILKEKCGMSGERICEVIKFFWEGEAEFAHMEALQEALQEAQLGLRT